MDYTEKQLHSELIFDGKVLHLYRDDILLPDGNTGYREYCKHVGAVCIVPLTDEDEVICVRQYRYAHRKMVLEIPAGKLDAPDEDPTKAALRELREETGAICQKLTYLGPLYTTPALIDEVIHMYMAEGLTFGQTDLDEDEFIEVERIPLNELVDRICRGEVPDSKTQACVLRAAFAKMRRVKGEG